MSLIELGIRLRTDFGQARASLEKIGDAASDAQEQLNKLGQAATKAEAPLKGLGQSASTFSSGVKTIGQSSGSSTRGITDVSNAAGVMGRSLQSARGSILGFISAYTGFRALSGFAESIVSVASESEKLQASLTAVTGSVENSKIAFSALVGFAESTPYQLNEVVDGFIRLKARGIDPTIERMTSFGNTASAMGKSFDQISQAVSHATEGLFRRLQDFGISASENGDKVTFTFNNVSTTVRKSAAAIVGYLEEIGKTKFAGAMELQMQTVRGVFTNVKDEFSTFARTVGDSGLNKGLVEIMKTMIGTTHTSENFAKTLGETVGSALHVLNSGLELISPCINDILAGFSALVGLKLAEWIVRGTVAMIGLNAEMRANPIGIIITGAQLLTVGISVLIEHFGGFSHIIEAAQEKFIEFHGWTEKLAAMFQDKFGGAIAYISDKFNTFLGHLSDVYSKISNIISKIPSFNVSPEISGSGAEDMWGGQKPSPFGTLNKDSFSPLNKKLISIDDNTNSKIVALREQSGMLANGEDVPIPTARPADLNSTLHNPLSNKIIGGEDTATKLTQDLTDTVKQYQQAYDLSKLTTDEAEKQSAIYQLENKYIKDGGSITSDSLKEAEEKIRGLITLTQQSTLEQKKQQAIIQENTQLYKQLADSISSGMIKGLEDIFTGGSKGFRKMLSDWRTMMFTFAEEILKVNIFKPIAQSLIGGLGITPPEGGKGSPTGGAFGNIFSGGNSTGLFSGLGKSLSSFFGWGSSSPDLERFSGMSTGGLYANGGVFGKKSYFANGDIFSQPTAFQFGNNKIGVMGEAGPEAVMPLTRIGGKLGVKTSGSGSNVSNTHYNMNMTVVTPDTGNFRKNQGQLMADMQLAIKRNFNRNN